MKSLFLKLAIVFLSAIYFHEVEAEEPSSSFPYITLGAGPSSFQPNLGLGYRRAFGKHGADISTELASDGSTHRILASVAYLRSFTPLYHAPWYAGIGIAYCYRYKNSNENDFWGHFDLIVGRVWKCGENCPEFLEIRFRLPQHEMHRRSFLDDYNGVPIPPYYHIRWKRKNSLFPQITVKYGMGF